MVTMCVCNHYKDAASFCKCFNSKQFLKDGFSAINQDKIFVPEEPHTGVSQLWGKSSPYPKKMNCCQIVHLIPEETKLSINCL